MSRGRHRGASCHCPQRTLAWGSEFRL